jgi:hypothetical protein
VVGAVSVSLIRMDGQQLDQSWFYCAMIAARISGKRKIRLKVTNKPIAQKSVTAVRLGSAIDTTSQDHGDAFSDLGRLDIGNPLFLENPKYLRRGLGDVTAVTESIFFLT